MGLSLAQQLAREPSLYETLSQREIAALEYSWPFWRRPEQAPPAGDWSTWLILAGRAWGKTRTASEYVREQVDRGVQFIALVGATSAAVRDVQIEGRSGLLHIFPPHQKPRYEPSKRRVVFHTGATATAYSAEEPDLLRGPEHELAWLDELASWRYLDDTLSNLRMGLRGGRHPRMVVTTTPRPLDVLRQMVADPRVHVTRGSTYDNRDNLPPAYFADIVKQYEGSRLGRQELEGEILDDCPGALFKKEWIKRFDHTPRMRRTIVAIDPAISTTKDSDETGIVVVGLGEDGKGYVLADWSGKLSPEEWSKRALSLYREYRAELILAETNRGGDMVEATLRTHGNGFRFRSIHGFKGKGTRAEPIAALYEQGKVLHASNLKTLEHEMTTWDPHESAYSPDRIDAMVWGLSELMLTGGPARLADVKVEPLRSRF